MSKICCIFSQVVVFSVRLVVFSVRFVVFLVRFVVLSVRFGVFSVKEEEALRCEIGPTFYQKIMLDIE